MAAQPIIVPRFRAFDSNGDPLAGGLLYSYEAGTTTPLATYTTRDASVANANPVVLDANGEADIWTAAGTLYKFVLKDSAGVTQWTADNVPSTADSVAFSISDGSVSAPGLAWANDSDSGLYRSAANTWHAVAGGVKLLTFAVTLITAHVKMLFEKGLEVTQSVTNGDAITGTGNGTGYGGNFASEHTALRAAGDDRGIEATSAGALGAVEGRNTAGGDGGDFANTAGTGYGLRCQGNATRGPLRIVGQASAPTAPLDGDVYYDTTTGKLRIRAAGAWVDLH